MQRHLQIAALISFSAAAAAQSFVNYESPIVSPVRLTPDGLRLCAAHTADSRLCVYSLSNPNQPVLVQEIVVGLEPVSVNARTNDEVWVVNHLSDSVSIVSLSQGRVVATLQVADEPSDVVFAGGKAFVTAAASDRVAVFDATTRASLGSVDVFGKDPRNLAVNAAGTKVYAVVQRSGNGTTTVQDQAQTLPPGSTLPAPPRTALIVRANDPAWAAQIPFTLPDNDVAEIDVATQTVSRNFRAVGTTNTGIAVNPINGDLWVANIEARNLVRFEPVLRGHAIDSRITRITTGATPTVTPIDLNPGINYAVLPNNAALGTALAEPYGVAFDAGTGRIYVAAQGTDRIGVLDGTGAVLARIEVGGTPGALIDTRNKRGPRGLALSTATQRLYVANKLSSTISVIDTSSNALLSEVKLGSYDPTPTNIRDGRKFLYDAKLAGNGTMSCASCHTDGDIDGLAWDLGDPNGVMDPTPVNTAGGVFNLLPLSPFHPMKGSMTTQTFKGLQATAPFHWRGDRANFQAFNGAFNSLMGGSLLSTADMNLYAQFATSIAFPPNPNQLKDRTLRTTPVGASEAEGQVAYDQTASNLVVTQVSCNSCHTHDPGNLTGTNRQIITGSILQEPQQMKVAQLRNMYRKVGFTRTAGQKKAGFGYTHDGSVGTLADFLALPVFNPWRSALGANVMSKIVPFLMAMDTGTAPTVGMQVTIDQSNATNAAAIADLDLLIARAVAGDIDLVAHGSVSGAPAALLYSVAGANFVGNATGAATRTKTQLLSLAQAGNAALTYMGVPPGAGQRIARDRDLDSLLDGDEASTSYGVATNGCPGAPRVRSNGEARLGSTGFALVGENGPASGFGYFVLGFDQANIPIVGINLLVDLSNPSAWAEFIAADARGTHARSLPIPSLSLYDGLPIYTQYAWLDTCQPQGLSASAGLRTALRAN
jgi:YVTN family beta-propeller protein